MHNEEYLFDSVQLYNMSLCRNVQNGYGANPDAFFIAYQRLFPQG